MALTRIANLDRIITLPSFAGTELDSVGVVIPSASVDRNVRAQLVAVSTAEEVHNANTISRNRATFRTRFVPGVSAGDKLLFEGAAYVIKSLREIGRRRWLEIDAETQP